MQSQRPNSAQSYRLLNHWLSRAQLLTEASILDVLLLAHIHTQGNF